MVIIAILILILYYWIFVTFDVSTDKPQNLLTPVVNLKGEVIQNNTVLFTLKKGEYYDGQHVKGPYTYTITGDKQNVHFTAPDDNFINKTWTFPLVGEYTWYNDRIFEKDSCFNISHGKVKAEGKPLFDYIEKGTLIQDYQIGHPLDKVFHSDHIFYFQCFNNKIQSLHSCAPGLIFKKNCEQVITCTGQADGFKYPHSYSKFQYFECLLEKPISKSCPKGELFEYDKCIVPQNLCLVKPDGFLHDIDNFSFMNCVQGKPVLIQCPPYTYALNGKCESSVCQNKHDDFVPIFTDNGVFQYANKYGKCKNGILMDTFECPVLWDYWDTDVNILHLPQVFHLNTCTKPVLCENVKIVDANVIVPQYIFAKHLKNWPFADIFDLLTGFKCDQQGNRIQVIVDPGELIVHYQKMKIDSSKIPTHDPTLYYENQKIQKCPPNTFFDAVECKEKIPNSFSFQHYDIFKFDNLSLNNWILPREADLQLPVSCTGEDVKMNMINACVHKDCYHLQFLYQLNFGAIKLDNQYECLWEANAIKKREYLNPYNLNLEFWDQRLSVNPSKNNCTFGTNIKTGHFILDSTIYMTCDLKQPFVFCPSSSTEIIGEKLGIYACIPKQTVYTIDLQPKTIVNLSGVLKIEIPANSFVTLGAISHFYATNTTLTPTDAFFAFECDKVSKIYFYRLPSNPENAYIENNQLQVIQGGAYDLRTHKPISQVIPIQYNLESMQNPVN